MAKPKYKDGQLLYITQHMAGTDILTGDLVRVIESYPERGASDTRYFVESELGTRKAYVYESDLSTRDPLEDSRGNPTKSMTKPRRGTEDNPVRSIVHCLLRAGQLLERDGGRLTRTQKNTIAELLAKAAMDAEEIGDGEGAFQEAIQHEVDDEIVRIMDAMLGD